MADERRTYASSPCMLHEFEASEGALALRILYLRIEETADGFWWQVRLHGEPDPMALSTDGYGSESAARIAGQPALSKACAQFSAFKGFG